VDGVDVAGPMTTALDEKRRFAWKGALFNERLLLAHWRVCELPA